MIDVDIQVSTSDFLASQKRTATFNTHQSREEPHSQTLFCWIKQTQNKSPESNLTKYNLAVVN